MDPRREFASKALTRAGEILTGLRAGPDGQTVRAVLLLGDVGPDAEVVQVGGNQAVNEDGRRGTGTRRETQGAGKGDAIRLSRLEGLRNSPSGEEGILVRLPGRRHDLFPDGVEGDELLGLLRHLPAQLDGRLALGRQPHLRRESSEH